MIFSFKKIKKQNLSEHSGFTLVEILIVLFIAGLLLGAFFTLFLWHAKIYNYQQAVVRTSGSNRATLQLLDFYGRQAYRILSSRDISGTTYYSGPTVLVLQLPSVSSSGEVLPGKWDYIAFYGSGKELYQAMAADASSSRVSGVKQLSDSLASIEFTYDNNDFSLAREISVDLRTELQVRDQLIFSRLQQNIYLKNF